MDLTSKSQKEIDNSSEIKNLKKIEAALFISARYLTIKELVAFTDINPLLLKELLHKLKNRYRKQESAVEILEKNSMWKMDVKQEYFDFILQISLNFPYVRTWLRSVAICIRLRLRSAG